MPAFPLDKVSVEMTKIDIFLKNTTIIVLKNNTEAGHGGSFL